MQYQALYRKYRPQHFAQVVGQEHVTGPLQREVAEGRIAHAYLFAGPRGTGKTTTARLLAKALNCPDRSPEGEPCGTCISCQEVADAVSLDVVELDAASHNKVEDIRDLRSGVSTVASVGGARRVFILDEAHMLTKAASNALLKTLEEPPDGVHFVLATTEPYRLLDTIRSRSQRFDFHLVGLDKLVKHLEEVSAAEGYQTTPEGLRAVARRAAGSVRDALSLLEQVAAAGETITEEALSQALGVASRDAFATLTQAIADEDAKTALELVSDLVAQGVDMRRFISDAIAFYRGVFLVMFGSETGEVTGQTDDIVADWKQAAEVLPRGGIRRAIELLGEGLLKLREGREERIMVELTLLKLVRPELDDDAQALAARIERLERGLPAAPTPTPETTARATASPPETKKAAPPKEPKQPPPQPAPAQPATPATQPSSGTPADELEQIWPQLVASVERMGPRRHAIFRDALPGRADQNTVSFIAPSDFFLQSLQEDEELTRHLAEQASALLGREVEVVFQLAGATTELPGQEALLENSSPSASPNKTGMSLEDVKGQVAEVFGKVTEVSQD